MFLFIFFLLPSSTFWSYFFGRSFKYGAAFKLQFSRVEIFCKWQVSENHKTIHLDGEKKQIMMNFQQTVPLFQK